MAKSTAKPRSGAAAKKKVSKSKAIRDYMVAKPDAGPTEVAAALGKKGMKVTPAFVSTIKSTDKKKKKRRGRPRAAKAGGSNDQFTVTELVQAKKLAEQIGGIDKAKAAIDALSKLS